jgi:hypothetical protein
VKIFYQTAGVITIQPEFPLKFECRIAPSWSAINRSVSKFDTTGSVIDSKKGVVGNKKSVKTPENIDHVEQEFKHSLRKSVKQRSQQLNLGASST